MRKGKFFLIFLLLIAMTTFCFFACTGKDSGGTDGGTEIVPVTVTATEEGISFSHPEINYFFFVLDDGERDEASADGIVVFSATPGKHTLKVFSFDMTGKEIAVARFEYTTVAVTLSDLSVSGKTISWVATAKTVSVKDTSDYISVEGTDYTTEKDRGTVYVKAEGGYDVATKTYYAGKAVTKNAKIVSTELKTLASPVIEIVIEEVEPSEDTLHTLPSWSRSVKRVNWKAVSHASKYAVSYDGGAFTEATTALLSDEVSSHTIRVKAIGDGETYEDSVPSVYQYETVRSASPDVLKTEYNSATVAFDAPKCYYSIDNFDFQEIEGPVAEGAQGKGAVGTFSAGASGTYYFRAWGFDAKACKNYVVSEAVSVSFLAPAASDLVVEDASTDGIADRWMAEQSTNGTRITLGDHIGYGVDYNGDKVLQVKTTRDGAIYRFSTAIDLSRIYDLFSFRCFGDGVSEVVLTLSSEEGYAVRRDLGVLPDYWQDISLRLDSEDWIVNDAEVALTELWSKRSSVDADDVPPAFADLVSLLEVFSTFDTLSVSIRCENGKGDQAAHSFGDIRFGYDPEASETRRQPLFAVAESFVAEESTDTLKNELLFFLGEDSTCKIYSTMLEENFILSGTYSIDEASAEMRFSGAEHSLLFSFTYNGRSATVSEATGAYAEHFLACAPLMATADVRMTLEEVEPGEPYLGADWSAYYLTISGDAVPLTSPHIHYGERDGVSALRFSVGNDLTDRFVFNENGGDLGLANTISLRIGNCMDEAAPLDFKLIATDKEGVRYYLKGSEGAFTTLEVTDGLEELSATLPKAISFRSLLLEVRNGTKNTLADLYVADLRISYKADPSVFSGYPKPTIEIGGLCSDSFERKVSVEDEPRLIVTYDDCNPFGMIGGDFGEVADLSTHTTQSASDSVVESFDTLAASFAAFMEHFTVPTDGTKYLPTVGADALSSYTSFYDNAVKLFNGSLASFTRNLSGDLTQSAVIGANHPYAMVFGNEEGAANVDLQSVVANLFGFTTAKEFAARAQDLVAPYAQYAADIENSVPVNEAFGNGCFYTANGSFVFPIAVKNDLPATVLTYVILDSQGLVSVWVNDITAALWATNYNASHHTEGIVQNKLYCKNTLFVTGPVGDTMFSFAYSEDDASFEYSLNDSEWIESSGCAVPSSSGYYTLRVRALIGEDRAPSQIESYSFYVEEVYLSAVSVAIGGEKGQTASWKTNGDVSIRVDKQTTNGVETEYLKPDKNEYFSDENVTLTVRAEGYYDKNEKKYYVGTQESVKKILVDVVLGTPQLQAGQEGLYWDEVQDANAYAVSVNDGDYVTREDRTYPFAINEGIYVVRVKSVLLDDHGEESAYGTYAEYTYEVKRVSLPALSVDKATVSWRATAYKTYLRVDVAEYEERPLEGSFKATVAGANQITVKAVAGYDSQNKVYYYAAKDLTQTVTVNVQTLSAPTILVKEDKSGLYWAFVRRDEGSGEIVQITTIEDYASTNPEVSYRIKVNDGEWMTATDYDFPTTAGEYSVVVKTIGNGENLHDSEESIAYVFTVREVMLSDDPEYLQKKVKAEGGSIISFEYISLHTYQKIGANATEKEIVESTFATDKTIDNYTIRVVGGWDAETRVYYSGKELSRTWKVVVPIKLIAPTITHSQEGIAWSVDQSQKSVVTGFRLWINEIEQGTTTATSMSFNEIGSYTVRIVVVNSENPEQYLDSEASEIIYTVANVSLTQPHIEGAIVRWEYVGLNLYIKLGETTQYNLAHPDNTTSYENNGENVKLFVLVKGGYDSENVVLYKGADEEKSLDIRYTQLLSPKLTVNTAGNGLEWEEVKDAGGYAYKELPADCSEEEIEAAMASEEGWSDTVGRTLSFETDENAHLVLIKARKPEGSTITDSEPSVWRYRACSISLDHFSVTKGVATWEKNGFTEIQKYPTVGSPVGLIPYESITECRLAPEKTIYIDLRCKAGYDLENNVFYHGETIKLTERHIIVPIPLEKPTVEMNTTRIVLTKETNANAYKISVNGGDFETLENDYLDYSSVLGSYTLRIRACHKTETEQYPESEDVVVRYDVRSVTLSDITEKDVSLQGGKAHFTADGLLSIGTDGVDYQPLLLDYQGSSYVYDYPMTATTTVYVKAEQGVRVLSETSAVKYVGEALETHRTVIIPIKLRTPTLNETSTKLAIVKVTDADQYLVSVDGGAWTPQTDLTVNYLTSIGDHTIRIKAHSTREDGQFRDSDEATVEYKTVALSLSDITVSGATFSWTAKAHTVKRSTDGKNWTPTTSNEYTATSSGTTKLYISAYSGYVSSSHTYYYGTSTITKEKSVTITKLSAPSLSVSGKNLTWSQISGAKQYAVKVGSGSYNYQTGTTYALSTQAGSYKITVKAVNRDNATVLDSDERTFEYTTKVVTLSNISVSGSKATWSATAYKTYLKVGSGSYTETTATSYSPTEEGTYAIKVKAEGGWNSGSKTYYYATAAIEKSASVTLAKLAKPTLTTNSKGVTWASVSNASTYAVKVDNGSYNNQSDKIVAFSTATGTHKVYVKAVAVQNSSYQDSDAAVFTYETKQTDFSILTSSSTKVTWKYTGLKAQYSTNGGSSYTDTTLTGYTATANGAVSFRAVGGWDAAGCVYYNGTTSAQSKSFTLPGLTIAGNFEKGVSGWTKLWYNNNGWQKNDNIVITSITDAYGAGSAMKIKSWLNSMSYRVGYEFGDLPTTYKSLSFDVKLADPSEAKTSFTFQDSASGTYVNYSLDSLGLTHGVWYHVTFGFEDSNLVVNSGGKDYTPAKAKSFLGESGYYEKIKALDTIFITVKGSTSNGAAVQTCFDNFQFSTATCSTATKTRINPTIELNFNDGTVNADYTNSKWKQYEYKNNTYASTSGKLKIESAEGDSVLSLYAGYNTYKITYNEGGSSLGTFNHFAIDLGCESSATVKYRIEILTDSGTIYAAGGEEIMATVSSPGGNAALKTVSFNFTSTKVKSITIYASAGNANGHLYMDNMILSNLS